MFFTHFTFMFELGITTPSKIFLYFIYILLSDIHSFYNIYLFLTVQYRKTVTLNREAGMSTSQSN